MDESMMSIELNQSIDDHFDDDDFIQETLNVSMNNNSTNVEFKLPSPVSELITNVTLPKCRLDFNVSDIDTPRNSSTVARNRKRRNFTRRCLSTDLNGDHNNMVWFKSKHSLYTNYQLFLFFSRIKCLFRNFVLPKKQHQPKHQ